MPIGLDFASHNGFNTQFPGRLDKKYQTVEAIGIGQGQFVYAPVPGGLTEFLDSADPPALGIMGMDV